MAKGYTKAKVLKKREQLIISHMYDERVRTVLFDMVRHYEIIDLMKRTNKATILKAIYFDPRPRSTVSMALKYFVCENTILRYRTEFLDCFQAAMTLRGVIDEIAIAWDNVD